MIILLPLLIGCGQEQDQAQKTLKKHTVRPEKIHKNLHFSGVIQPLKENTITNPVDGVIESMPFAFGQKIEKNKTIFVLKSSELQKQYNDSLTEYLKAKDAYNVSRSKFNGTNDLWKAGLISKNNFLGERSNLSNARVAMEQRARKLAEMIRKVGDEECHHEINALDLAQFDKVQSALSKRHDRIHLRAPVNGVLIYPPQPTADDKNNRIAVGSTLKTGQLLALVGDMSGIRVEIDVPEVDIDKIKPGMQAVVRSIAYPNDVMKGALVSINAQATAGTGNSLPTFPALVEVKSLTDEQAQWVKVGMTVKVELKTQSRDKLMVPIQAVKYKQGKSIVKREDTSGHIQEISVTTGVAQADKVAIEAGLKPDDIVVYE